MSWYSRLGAWGKSSPLPSPTSSQPLEVTEQHYSYMTADDIAKDEEQRRIAISSRPSRDTDVILLKHRRATLPTHFPAYSIDDGELTIGTIRKAATKKVDLLDNEMDRIKLFYRGKILKDDARSAYDEGLRSDIPAEILMVIAGIDPVVKPSSSGEEDDEEEETSSPNVSGGKKKRLKKKKKKNNNNNNNKKPPQQQASAENSGRSTPLPDATFAPFAAPKPSAAPKPVKPILTPIEKLDSLTNDFRSTFVTQCDDYVKSPPSDETKKKFEHKRLSEMILEQILLKVDGVETEGNEEARQKRKALVKEVQGYLNRLDEALKK